MYWSDRPRLQWLSLILLVFLVPHLLGFTVHQLSEARPLNTNTEVEGRKKQSLFSSSPFEALVKEQHVANKGEIGKHVMSAAPRVHGGEYVSIEKGPVPPSDSNPTTRGP